MTDPVKIVGDRCRAPAAASGVTALSSQAMEPASGLHPDGLQSAGAWPAELTPELADILGRQCFMFISFAQVYRAAGFDIPTSAEAEQAFFLHRFLSHWFRHGDAWKDAATEDLREVHARVASVGRNAKRHDPAEGRGPQDEHAVGSEADETLNSPSDHPGERA